MSPNGIIRIFICLATLASATLVSCRRTGHEEPVPGTGTERPDDVRVSFRIALGSTNPDIFRFRKVRSQFFSF